MPAKSRQHTSKAKKCKKCQDSEDPESPEVMNAFLPIQSQPVSRHHKYDPYLRKTPRTTLSGQVFNIYFPYMPSGEYPGEAAHFTEAYSHGCQLFSGTAMAQCLVAYGL